MTKYFDNLFSANSRRAMIQNYGATEAMWIPVDELEVIAKDIERNRAISSEVFRSDESIVTE